MSIPDSLGGLFAQQGGVQSVLTSALQTSGGFQGVLDKLNQAGLGAKVNSWLGQGENVPISAAEIQGALGNDHLRQLAARLGVPLDQVAALVSQHLPGLMDSASPNGTLQRS